MNLIINFMLPNDRNLSLKIIQNNNLGENKKFFQGGWKVKIQKYFIEI